MNILITGSSGFIANHLIYKLRDNFDCNIYGIDLKTSLNITYVFDVRKKFKNLKIPKQIDLIINLAAIHREPGHQPYEYYDTNILGAENICELSEKFGCNQIIFTKIMFSTKRFII